MELTEPILYIDPQREKPGCFCPECGGERYAPTYRCIRCERSGP